MLHQTITLWVVKFYHFWSMIAFFKDEYMALIILFDYILMEMLFGCKKHTVDFKVWCEKCIIARYLINHVQLYKKNFLSLWKYLGERDMVWYKMLINTSYICAMIFAAVQMGMGKKLIHHFRYVFLIFPRHKAEWRISCSRAGMPIAHRIADR